MASETINVAVRIQDVRETAIEWLRDLPLDAEADGETVPPYAMKLLELVRDLAAICEAQERSIQIAYSMIYGITGG